MATVRPVVNELPKVLLYLNLSDAEQVRIAERDDLERRFAKFGQKLTAHRKARLAGTYNRIVIGPRIEAMPSAPGEFSGVDEGLRLRPHWRRGHFRRIRYGEGHTESRLGWIHPTLVNSAGIVEIVKTKPYVVR